MQELTGGTVRARYVCPEAHTEASVPHWAAIALALAIAAAANGQDVMPCMALQPKPCATPDAAASKAVATIDGEAISLADLDATTRKKVDGLDAAVAEARRNALRAEIDDVLLDLEAARRGISRKQLLASEVLARTKRPSEEEIAKEIGAHPDKYKRGKDDSEWAAGSLYDSRFDALKKDLVGTIEKRFPVSNVADAATTMKADAVIAVVGPRRIKASEVRLRMDSAAADVRIEAAESEKEAIDKLIDERLAKAESARRNVSVDQLTQEEVTAKTAAPTDAELKTAWTQWKSFFDPDFEKARPAVVKWVGRDRKNEAEKAFHKRLRSGHSIDLQVDVPKRPTQKIDAGSSPSTGDRGAAVTVVEWGDYQCPPCGYMAAVSEEALRPFGNRVRYVFKQFPNSFHEYAWKAAEAALAADAQGKFFPYARVLFAHQKDLGVASLKKYAQEAGLDAARFARDLDSGRFAGDVLADKLDGQRAGVPGTPTFFINGDRMSFDGYNVEGMRNAVEAAMGAAKRDR